LVYRSLVWCGAVGYVSGLRDISRLALSCSVCVYMCVGRGGDVRRPVEKEGSARHGFVRELVCLFAGCVKYVGRRPIVDC